MSSRAGQSSHAKVGEIAWQRMNKTNAELFTLTYGATVTQLIKDYENIEEVNQQLEKMGYNIGIRLIDEFLAKANIQSCQDFRETAETIAKIAFKMFLGVTAEVTNWNGDFTSCSLLLYDNPLVEFVELPPSAYNLHYSNVLCGVMRGALSMVQMRVECRFVRDVLRGDEVNEIRLELKELLADAAGEDYNED